MTLYDPRCEMPQERRGFPKFGIEDLAQACGPFALHLPALSNLALPCKDAAPAHARPSALR
jgi:hypothetical protein